MNPDPTIQSELLSYLGQLRADDQIRVVDFARTLAGSTKPPVHGTPGKELLRMVGTISHEDLQIMQQVIEEDCERIDPGEW